MTGTSHDLLFVYGTLLKRADHSLGSLMRSRSRLVGEGVIRARLYVIRDPDDALNFYPGAVPSAGELDHVYGEVYEITAPGEVYPILDDYEACSEKWPEPHEFLRRRVTVRLNSGREVWASCYLYTWDVSHAGYIKSGRYDSLDAALVR